MRIISWVIAIIVIGFGGGYLAYLDVPAVYLPGAFFWIGIVWQKAWPVLD